MRGVSIAASMASPRRPLIFFSTTSEEHKGMSFQRIDNVNLYYERSGRGSPLVLVHGSWGDHNNWAAVTPRLSQSFQVVTFDRRGHSQSETGPNQGSFAEDADDLGALIEELDLAPAHVVGNSAGAIIALRLAAKRPELFRTLVVHEPPLVRLLEGQSDFQPMLEGVNARIRAVVELLQAGEMEAAARSFVETVAFGPGAWDTLPQSIRDTFIRNAPTFLDETNDPEGVTIDLSSLRSFEKPALVTTGTASPPFFGPIAEIVAQALPMSTLRRIDGAGHVPQISHPDLYVELIRDYCEHSGGEAPATSAKGI
jgi:pimeloyl-ACP methyl ester carboxylesterase